MRYESGSWPSLLFLLPLVLGTGVSLALTTPAAASVRERHVSPSDSSDLVKKAHERQRDFEFFRQSRIPVEMERSGGSCDAQIGRICIWFGGEEEADFPEEAIEVGMARNQLIQLLAETGGQISDPWVTGQRVRYLAESGALGEAERVARTCELTDAWWCSALLGYVLHLEGKWVEAEASFRQAALTLPKDERQKWLSPHYIISRDDEKTFNKAEPAERDRKWELFWRLSDPLYLVDGNDRLTDHFARWVEAHNEEDAENAQGLFWEDDLEETLIRYGRIVGYSRTHAPQSNMRAGGGFSLQDTRRVVGHHQTHSRGYLFPAEFLSSPSEIPPESWITAPRESRTWYAPPYAPDFRALESQVGRFRRGDEMLVVGAYQPEAPVSEPAGPGQAPPRPQPPLDIRGPVQAGLFLIPEEGGDAAEIRGTDAHGVLTLHAKPGKYVSSLEVLDAGDKRAWRARQGVRQVPLVPGLVALSDLMILEEGAPYPGTLEEAIPHVRPGVRVRRGERFTVVWEVYGLRVQQPAQVTIGFTQGRPAFLQRVGEFLGVIDPGTPVQISFEDPGSDQVQSAFRAVEIALPDLEPGDYTLHLRLDLPGREPAIVSRPIVVEEAG
ncbi:MAG TPA: hypothetical protein VJ997_10280 [Longimicrobiales bacterium]|nr:hypothetical protein [Longimicrobiales bacterium]